MKRHLLLLLGTALLFCSIAWPQQPKPAHFKKIQEFLPTKALSGFVRSKAIGSTQTTMGMTMSEASVRYVKAAIDDTVPEQNIAIKIQDMSAMPYAAWAMAYQQQDMDSETEDGYEKTVTVKNIYKGIEKARTGESKSCELNFGVGNRFNVSFDASNISDSKLIYELAKSMDLDKLSTLTGDK